MSGTAHDLSKLRIDRDPPPAVRRAFIRNLIIAAVALLVVGVAVVFARRRSSVPVETVVATPIASSGGAGITAVTANGYVVARIRASVAAKIPGRLATLPVDGGSVVRRGEVIAQLENADYRAAVSEAKANLATARAQLIEAEAERDQARRDADRVLRMRATDPALISTQDTELAESRAEQTAARAAAARARVEATQAALRFAEANFENTFIRAPFTGTVLRKEAEVGEVVAPSVGGGLTRGAVVTMADLSSLEVEVDVNEAYIGRVQRNQPADITLDAYPDTSFRGSVRQVVPTADRQRATVQVKVAIVDRDPRILPEMGARVNFIAPPADGTGDPANATAGRAPRFRLPAAAVRDAGGRSVVWVVREGRLEPRDVEAGPVSAGYREINRGLAGGELVLTGGVETPQEGMRVEPSGGK
ncbi:MAG TPA: efflux RND transporter periplasmic adaptor subunit [Gemmatimonadales bacterium]|nr:efflux RND transporter periplasmic adaptor subunit [Gemmatimonadales bacterium]